jgi:dihydroorotase
MQADLVIKNGWIVTPEATTHGGVAISDGKFVAIGTSETLPDGKQVIDAAGHHILPGIIDAHVHFRDPGVTHKEDFGTGSTAAVCGGVTTIVDMPNQLPPTENAEQVGVKKKIGESKSLCDFAVLGVVHQTNADDILPMAKAGAIGYKIFFGETIGNLPFPDDGMCIEVFSNITKSGVPLCVHAENRQIQHYWTNKLKAEGKNDPIYWESSRPYLCEAESVAHVIFLAENFGTMLHIVHTSSKQAAQMIKDAKARGLRVTAETCPHYLLREGDEMAKIGPLLKMNPPVRSRDHAEALWHGLLNGTIDMIATDHSPHTFEEKGCDRNGKMSKPAIWECISGFCGVETAVSAMLTEVNKGRMTLNHYVRLASENPARVWQMYPKKGAIRLGSDGDVTIVDMNKEKTIDGEKLHSKNTPTPWHGWKVKGVPIYTIVRGHIQMKDGEPVGKVIGQMQTPIRDHVLPV